MAVQPSRCPWRARRRSEQLRQPVQQEPRPRERTQRALLWISTLAAVLAAIPSTTQLVDQLAHAHHAPSGGLPQPPSRCDHQGFLVPGDPPEVIESWHLSDHARQVREPLQLRVAS